MNGDVVVSAHVEVWRDAFGSLWQWTCTITACSGYFSGDDDAPTHAEALQAALDHCARYPIKRENGDIKR